MEEIKLNIPQFHTVTRSFAKKINLEQHIPGHKYEAEDFFASHNESIPVEEATPEKIKEVSEKLFALAVADVEAAMTARIRTLRAEQGISVEPTGDELAQVSNFIDLIEKAKKVADLEDVVAQIKEEDWLNEIQKEYLRSIMRKAEAKVKK